MKIAEINKNLVRGGRVKRFELTYSTNSKQRTSVRRENERLRMKKKGVYIDNNLIL